MKMRKELNNKGFSLVELLIATIILGIVVAPLLHSFVTAASVTTRSRQMGDATLVSENIAETVVATSLEQLFKESNPSKYFAGATKKALYSYDGSTYTEITTPATANQYYLGVQGVQAGSSTFNAMIKLDAGVYRNGSSGINDVKLSDYSKMDALYAQSLDVTNPDVLAWSALQEEISEKYENVEWDPDSAEPVRTIILDIIQDEEDPDEINVLLRMEYTYTFDYYDTTTEPGTTIRREDSITIDPIRYAPMDQPFSVTTNGRLPNIYVMYYPLYESASVTNDIIRINNMVNKVNQETNASEGNVPNLVPDPNGVAQPFKIFLVKEETKTSSGAKDPNLATKEYNYMAAVEQYVPAGTPESQFAVVYSNIREDLATGSNLGNKVTYDIYRGNYFSIKGRFGGENPSNDANYKGGDLVSRSKYNRIFDVTVEIFDAEDTAFAAPIHTFHATKLQ